MDVRVFPRLKAERLKAGGYDLKPASLAMCIRPAPLYEECAVMPGA
jgi:hypothetical protein